MVLEVKGEVTLRMGYKELHGVAGQSLFLDLCTGLTDVLTLWPMTCTLFCKYEIFQ